MRGKYSESEIIYFLDISWTCPGRNNVVIIHDKKQGTKKTRALYVDYIKKAYSSFKTETPAWKICFSRFCDMGPLEVKLVQDIPHWSYLCIIYHQHERLLLVTLNKHVKIIPIEFPSLELIICDQNNEGCMLGACSECAIYTALKSKESISGVTWCHWNSMKVVGLKNRNSWGKLPTVFNSLKNYIPIFWDTQTSKGSSDPRLRRRLKVFNLAMKKLSFKLISLKSL